MANQFHRAKLCEGALAWNLWRDTHPLVVPDLEEVALSPSQRQFGLENWGPIDLRRVRLGGADLRYACLTAADLEEANLLEANLTSARLERANLTRATLSRAVLDDADLAGARLDAAVVDGARLSQARNVTQSQIDRCLGDRDTTLPSGLTRPTNWLRRGDISEKTEVAARVDGAGAPAADETEDQGKRAAAEIFKTIELAKQSLASRAERKAGHAGAGSSSASVAKPRLGASSKGLAYIAGSAIAAAIAALLIWSQWITAVPANPDQARGGIAFRPAAPPADQRYTGAAALARVRAVSAPLETPMLGPGEVAGWIERPGAAPSILTPPRENAFAPDLDEKKPLAAGTIVSGVAPGGIRPAAADPDAAPLLKPPSLLAAEAAAAARDAPAAPRARASLAIAGVAAKRTLAAPAPKVRSGPRPRVAAVRARRESSGSPHPFAAPPCKLTAACRAGLDICGC